MKKSVDRTVEVTVKTLKVTDRAEKSGGKNAQVVDSSLKNG